MCSNQGVTEKHTMLDIGQIRKICREVKDTTSRADNSLRQLVSEIRSMRRQKANLTVKLLEVNRILLEIKRNNYLSLVKQGGQETGRCIRSPEKTIDSGEELSRPLTTAPAANTSNDKPKPSTNTERPTEFEESGFNCKLSEQLKTNIPPQNKTSYPKVSALQIDTNQRVYPEDIHWLPSSDIADTSQNNCEISPLLDKWPENAGDSPDVCDLPCSCRRCARRDSGYVSCCFDTDTDTDSISCRARSCSSSSFISSSSTLSLISLLSGENSSHSSRSPLSPSPKASISSLIF